MNKKSIEYKILIVFMILLMVAIFFLGKNSVEQQGLILQKDRIIDSLRTEVNIKLDSLYSIQHINQKKDSTDEKESERLKTERESLHSTDDLLGGIPYFELWPDVARQLDSAYDRQLEDGYKPYSGVSDSKNNKPE